jgi:uncharacterized protein (TIGR00369 family)
VSFSASDPAFAERVRKSFEAQALMRLLGASLERVEPGEVDIALGHRPDLTQQHGYLHAGILTAIADSACGYAAYTLMPEDSEVLSVEFKLNLLRPAAGERFVARGRVVRAGRTLTTAAADVLAFGPSAAEGGKLVATMLGTMIRQHRQRTSHSVR